MSKVPKRTAKDERAYVESALREGPVKSALIQDLLHQREALLGNQSRLLTALLEANKSLEFYRRASRQATEELLENPKEIEGFYWDNLDGWHRTDEQP